MLFAIGVGTKFIYSKIGFLFKYQTIFPIYVVTLFLWIAIDPTAGSLIGTLIFIIASGILANLRLKE
jgi:hypothetical protein